MQALLWNGGFGGWPVRGPYEDAPVVLNVDIQVMPVKQHHPHQRDGARLVGLDLSRLAVPEYGDAIYVELRYAAIGESSLAAARIRQP